jgi:hypothetical protein
VIALIFGKITYKDNKKYVRKYTEKMLFQEGDKEGQESRGDGSEDAGDGEEGDRTGGESCKR